MSSTGLGLYHAGLVGLYGVIVLFPPEHTGDLDHSIRRACHFITRRQCIVSQSMGRAQFLQSTKTYQSWIDLSSHLG